MSTSNDTGTVNGSACPTVAELIRFEVEAWYGSRHPDPEHRETLSAEAFERILTRVADRAYAASQGQAAPTPPATGCLYHLGQLAALLDAIRQRIEPEDDSHLLALVQIAEDLAERIGGCGHE